MKGTAKYSLCYIGHNTMYGYNIHVFLHVHIMMYYAMNSYRYIVKIRNLVLLPHFKLYKESNS